MDWGMKNRLSRIIKNDGKTVMLAVDHGYFMGPTGGLENITKTIEPIIEYADCLMLTKGALRNYVDASIDTPIVLRVSGGTSILNEKNLLHEGLITSIEEAIRLNVSGIAFSIMVGAEFERDTLLAFSQIIDEGEKYGIPALAVTAVGKGLERDARYLSLATRIAGELGARFVKTYYCEKDFDKVVNTSPVPVVIAGGKKIDELEALNMAYSAIKSGASGVDMGRNIFQSDSPVGMMKAIKSIVHEKRTPEEAFEIYNSNR